MNFFKLNERGTKPSDFSAYLQNIELKGSWSSMLSHSGVRSSMLRNALMPANLRKGMADAAMSVISVAGSSLSLKVCLLWICLFYPISMLLIKGIYKWLCRVL